MHVYKSSCTCIYMHIPLHGCPIRVYRARCIIIYILVDACLVVTYMYTTVHRHRMSNVCLPLVVKHFPDQVQFVYCMLDVCWSVSGC